MKKRRAIDEDMPVGKLRIIPDFLPSPEEIASSFKKQKVTLLIDQRSLDFFKARAKRLGAKYQQMMREVLSHYTLHHSKTRRHRRAA